MLHDVAGKAVRELTFHRRSLPAAVVSNSRPDWKAALESIKGIYLITDTRTGKRYVGSAYGDQGIWSRWCAYAASGRLRDLEKTDAARPSDGQGPWRDDSATRQPRSGAPAARRASVVWRRLLDVASFSEGALGTRMQRDRHLPVDRGIIGIHRPCGLGAFFWMGVIVTAAIWMTDAEARHVPARLSSRTCSRSVRVESDRPGTASGDSRSGFLMAAVPSAVKPPGTRPEVRQETGVAKARSVAAYVRTLVEAGEPVLLGGWHRAVYDIWNQVLVDLKPVNFPTMMVAEKIADSILSGA
ncbi:GIY-YIG nuclease family protein [Paracoccus mutanolyticus]|uniref:hypothetical protein n=1 Tax=Paracoccus mutanolyticus TaxID=1499308 RepID=UPI001679D00B|nr:hypothetical protein [Paracoccus mutanolyticus]